ncbi:DUF1489 domain-containing protein [Acetobacteraceae bacterium ESL0709]|nr:DUF1489 domain-containing protein [Acetobacteraceae bacterium ESL0697]MDF7677497.1 DUF1489 domain-containing protein [Acetobacteraceae bacterium ESL0709]
MLHMIKLAVGCSTVEELQKWVMLQRHKEYGFVRTRTMPKRAEEILAGGSLYRVMEGFILCRQPIKGFEPYARDDGHTGTLILVSDKVIPVQPRPMRPFQGWRYFKPEDAPPDLGGIEDENGINLLPPVIKKRLTELGLL